jgi:hypothetical protein
MQRELAITVICGLIFHRYQGKAQQAQELSKQTNGRVRTAYKTRGTF